MSNYRELAKQPTWVSVDGLELYELARQEYGGNNYSLVSYSSLNEKVIINCKIHGLFRQSAIEHLRRKQCPACASENRKIVCKSRNEQTIGEILAANGIEFQCQKSFLDCRYERPLPFDFYFVKNNIRFLVEYDGAQHYYPVDHFGGEEAYKARIVKDEIKNAFARENGLVLIRIPYTQNDDLEGYLLQEIDKYAR